MKIKVLLLLAVVTFLTSCEDNDNTNVNITSENLIGTWNLASQKIEDGSFSTTFQGQNVSFNYAAIAKDIDFTYTFSEKPNKLNLNGSYNLVATISAFGIEEIREEKVDTNLYPTAAASWSLEGNTITFTEENDLPAVLNVEEFTGNYLKLKGEINETATENGEAVTIKATIIIELEK